MEKRKLDFKLSFILSEMRCSCVSVPEELSMKLSPVKQRWQVNTCNNKENEGIFFTKSCYQQGGDKKKSDNTRS